MRCPVSWASVGRGDLDSEGFSDLLQDSKSDGGTGTYRNPAYLRDRLPAPRLHDTLSETPPGKFYLYPAPSGFVLKFGQSQS